MFQRLRHWWMVLVEILGKVQTAILLSLVYHLTVGPLGIAAKVARQDLLELQRRQGRSYARDLKGVSSTLEKARRQF